LKTTIYLLLVLVVSAITLFTACPKRQEKPSLQQSSAAALEQALKLKQEKRYPQAEEAFTFVIFNFPGSTEAADAQFHLADCYFLSRNYQQAQSEFEFYLSNYPHGRYEEEAAFKLALSTFLAAPGPHQDQTQSRRAQELFLEFLERYPESTFRSKVQEVLSQIDTRLAYNDLEAARLYFKAGEYKSALVYYQYIQQTWPNLTWQYVDRYRLGVCYLETGDTGKAKQVLSELVTDSAPLSVLRPAQRLLNRITSH